MTPLILDRSRILAFRRRAGTLDTRMQQGGPSLHQAAWAGLQDSMPRAALLSIHARVEGTRPTTWEDPELTQLWGPRFSAYVVSKRDFGIFSLGRLSDDPAKRRLSEDLATRLSRLLDGRSMTYAQAGRALGEHPNYLRNAAPTGTIAIRWEGARQPTIHTVPAPSIDPKDARLELARRYLHVFGPSTAISFAKWAGIKTPSGMDAFEALGSELTQVRTPIGEAWLLTSDVETVLAPAGPPSTPRLLPSGDSYFLCWGDDRELLVPDARNRPLLWTPRVWPGAILAEGEIVGTWRRANHSVTLESWSKLGRKTRDAIAEEATSLPIPNLQREIVVRWSG